MYHYPSISHLFLSGVYILSECPGLRKVDPITCQVSTSNSNRTHDPKQDHTSQSEKQELRNAPYKVPALLPARFNLKSPSLMPASPSKEVP